MRKMYSFESCYCFAWFFHTESCKFFFPPKDYIVSVNFQHFPTQVFYSQLLPYLQRTGVLFTHLVITMFLFIVLYGNVSFLLLFHREPGCVFHDYGLFIYLPSQHPITTGSPAQQGIFCRSTNRTFAPLVAAGTKVPANGGWPAKFPGFYSPHPYLQHSTHIIVFTFISVCFNCFSSWPRGRCKCLLLLL